MNIEKQKPMPIVLYNPTSRGKFMKYVSVGGVTKSVWVDAFKEYLVPEVDDTSALVNKVDRARIERAERLENSKTIDAYIFREKLLYLKKVTEEARWQKRITTRFTDKIGFTMTRNGITYAFSVDSLSGLGEIGTIIYSSGVRPNRLGSNYDGDYKYGADLITITSGAITAINGSTGADQYTLRNLLGTSNQIVYVQDGASLTTNTQFYTDEALETIFNSTTTYRFDVPATDTNRKFTLSNGRITAVESYTMQAPITFYRSGATATTTVAYVETGVDVTDPADSPILFSDDQGINNSNLSQTLITISPYLYYVVSNGRVTETGSAEPAGGGGGGSPDSYTFTQGRVNTTVYTTKGVGLVKGTRVYTDTGLSSALADGDYTNGGNTYTIKSGAIFLINGK